LVFDVDTGVILASLYYGETEAGSQPPLRVITHIKLIGYRTATGERVGKVVSYCGEQRTFYLHALDGRLLATKYDLPSPSSTDGDAFVTSMAYTRNGRYAVSGRSDGLVVVWNLDDLSVRDSMDVTAQRDAGGAATMSTGEKITAMGLHDDRLLLVGLKSGLLRAFPLAL
jgi:WD40 repeat protein